MFMHAIILKCASQSAALHRSDLGDCVQSTCHMMHVLSGGCLPRHADCEQRGGKKRRSAKRRRNAQPIRVITQVCLCRSRCAEVEEWRYPSVNPLSRSLWHRYLPLTIQRKLTRSHSDNSTKTTVQTQSYIGSFSDFTVPPTTGAIEELMEENRSNPIDGAGKNRAAN